MQEKDALALNVHTIVDIIKTDRKADIKDVITKVVTTEDITQIDRKADTKGVITKVVTTEDIARTDHKVVVSIVADLITDVQ